MDIRGAKYACIASSFCFHDILLLHKCEWDVSDGRKESMDRKPLLFTD